MKFGPLPSSFQRKDKNATTPLTGASFSNSNREPFPTGLKILADGVNPVVDVVAVHGLNGHREKSWTVDGVNWLRDLLPLNIENARIFSWGYDANTHSSSQISVQYLYEHAKTLVGDLCLQRQLTETRKRPIIFVAHSLGGIVVKSALIHSDAARQGAVEDHRSIKLSTYGILFIGTPHQGGNGVHLGEIMLKIASIVTAADNKILKHLERDSEWLQQQLGQYGPISGDFVTKFAYEIYPTPIALGKAIVIVPQASAIVPGAADAESIAIPANHLNMIKFASREDEGYKKISGHLQLLAKGAPDAIKQRWLEQERIKKARVHPEDSFSIPFSLFGAPEIEKFVGRKKKLAAIKEAFQVDGSQRKVVILHGLGGMGKTQLAVEFVKNYRDDYSATFWFNGRDETTLKKSFAGMAKRLSNEYPSSGSLAAAAKEKNVDRVVEIMKQWLSTRRNTRWIMVFDNVDNPKLPETQDPKAYDIKSYFPEAHQGFILITTRSSRLRIGKVIPIKKILNIRESIEILSSTSGRPLSDQDPSVVELIKELDGLPLALATAGAYLNQVSISLQEYLGHYRTSWLKLQETTPNLLSYDNALYTTWNITLEHIQAQSTSAAMLLRLWAYFDNQDLWYKLLAAGSFESPEWFSELVKDELSFTEATRLLCDHALIERLEDSDGYGMHACVHAWTVHVLNAKKDLMMARLALVCVGQTVPDKDVAEYWIIRRRLFPHARICSTYIYEDLDLESQDDKKMLQAARSLASLYCSERKFQEAEQMYLQVLKGFERILGFDHKDTLFVVNQLGVVYQNQKKFEKAEEMFQRALKRMKSTLGSDHPRTLKIVNNLSTLYQDQMKFEKAEEMCLRALTAQEKICGFDHSDTLRTVNDLGIMYAKQKKFDKAEQMYLRALTARENFWGFDHPTTLKTVDRLATLYADQKKFEKAEEMCLRALTAQEKICGFDHPDTLHTVHDLGIMYATQKKFDKAEELYLRALTAREKIWGFDHPTTLKTVNRLATLYADQKKFAKAEEMYLRALTGGEKVFGFDHSDTLSIVHNLGVLYANQEEFEKAEEMYLRALTGYEKAWGSDHLWSLKTRFNLSLLYAHKLLFKDAAQHLNLAIEGYIKIYGPKHPETVKAVNQLKKVKAVMKK